MELRHLRYFVATAEDGTVSRAAGRLHVTQPGLSRQLRQLEQELGVGLFDRTGGRLSLSRTGRALLPLARDLLERADAFQVAATFHAHGRLDHITIAAPTVTLTDVVAPFIVTMEPDDPVAAVVGADARDPAPRRCIVGADLAIGIVRPRGAVPLERRWRCCRCRPTCPRAHDVGRTAERAARRGAGASP